MKTFYTFLSILCFTLFLNAQQANNDFANQMNTIFQHLEKNRVPHGILTDFGLEYVDLGGYDGNLSNENHTSRTTVHESFYTLISSRIRQVNKGFMQPIDFEKLWHSKRTQRLITIGGLYFKYSKFKDDARTSGKVNIVKNKLYDVYNNGVWQNPYEDKSMFMLAPSINYYKGLNLKVKLPHDIFLSNYPSEIQSVEIDFGDGLGYRMVTYNQIINVNYSQANTYIWKYKLNLTNNHALYSHSEIIIEEGLNTRPYRQVATKNGALDSYENSALDTYEKISVTATEAYYGKYGTATLYIRDVNDDGISNPLIVAEGFDTGAILNPEQEAGDSDINDFLEEVEDGGVPLENEIDTYDIIYVDWDNGVDFIQRNAFAFVEAIRWVNQEKEDDAEQNVVLGQSMGGLVARYALTDIEQNQNFNHDTDLYISHDAPHLGANTPIAMQHFNRHVKNIYQSMPLAYNFAEVILPLAYDAAGIFTDYLNDEFNTNLSVDQYVSPAEYLGVSDFPASRQMLYNWVAPNYSIFNGVHDIWQQELSAMGYPQGYPNAPIRNIAIANGSECGVTQSLNGDIISISKDAADKTVMNAVIGLTDLGVSLGLILGGNFIDALWLTTLAVLPGSSSYDIDFHMRPMLNLNESKEIYYGRIRYKKKILWFIPVNVNFTKVDLDQPSGILPFDTYGGGWFDPENVIDDLPSIITDFLEPLETQRYNFIPTASALDAGRGTTALNDLDYKRDYVGANPPAAPKNSPFDNFVTHFDGFNPANNNSEHISFNRINGNWLVAELEEDAEFTDCSFACQGNSSITGPSLICNNGTYTFQDGPDFINWSIDPPHAGNISIDLSNPNQITVTRNGFYNGSAILTAEVTSTTCDNINIPVPIEIWVGGPNTNQTTSVSGTNNLNPGQTGLFSVNSGNFNSATSFSWVLFSNQFSNASQYFELNQVHNGLFTVKPDFDAPGGYYSVQVRATNACGFYPVSKTIYVEEGDGTPVLYSKSSNIYKIYPNPSSTTLNISLVDKTQQPISSEIIFGELRDLNGLFISRIEINDNRASVDASNLRKGIYILRIYYDGKSEGHQVIVE